MSNIIEEAQKFYAKLNQEPYHPIKGSLPYSVMEIESNWYDYLASLEWYVDAGKCESQKPELISALWQAVKEVL